MFMCHECGWTGNKTELDDNSSCPDCGSIGVSLADSLEFVPGEAETPSLFPEDIEAPEVEEGTSLEDSDIIE